MTETTRDDIRAKAIQMIRAAPHGLRHADLPRTLSAQMPDVTVHLIDDELATLRHCRPRGMSLQKRVYRQE
jgi:hypothetical protein